MIPKPGDLANPGNWRPLAILNITGVKPILEAQQSKDQVGFRFSVGVDDAFAVFENVCSKSMDWSVPMWCASLGLRTAFDRIEYNALFHAMRARAVPHELLTNVRYADDLMLYARSDIDLASMVESLVEELAAVGLHLDTSKTKILTTQNLKAIYNVP